MLSTLLFPGPNGYLQLTKWISKHITLSFSISANGRLLYFKGIRKYNSIVLPLLLQQLVDQTINPPSRGHHQWGGAPTSNAAYAASLGMPPMLQLT